MSTIESIGTGGDYATPQDWYNAHAGNITSDVNAPYIGELTPEIFSGGLVMSGSTTDITHYFHLRAKTGSEFNGNFSGAYPEIRKTSGDDIVKITDNYTRLEHFCVGNTTNRHNGIFVDSVNHIIIDACGVHNMDYNNDIIDGAIHVEGDSTNVVIRNCAVGSLSTDGAAGAVSGIYIEGTGSGTCELYNNTVNQLNCGSVVGTAYGIIVGDQLTAKIINNVIGVISAPNAKASIYTTGIGTLTNIYNGGENATGLGSASVSGWSSANVFVNSTDTNAMDLHLKPGQPGNVGAAGANPLRQAGLNLRKSSLYISTPTYDIDNDVRGVNVPWNMGADGDAEGVTKGTSTTGMLCKKSDGTYTYAQWRLFYAQCPKINSMCNANSSGYVSASQVCQLSLW